MQAAALDWPFILLQKFFPRFWCSLWCQVDAIPSRLIGNLPRVGEPAASVAGINIQNYRIKKDDDTRRYALTTLGFQQALRVENRYPSSPPKAGARSCMATLGWVMFEMLFFTRHIFILLMCKTVNCKNMTNPYRTEVWLDNASITPNLGVLKGKLGG